MKAIVNLLGYKGIVRIVEETETGYEIEMLEGTLQGKRTFISHNSQSETIRLLNNKFASKVEYGVHWEEDSETYKKHLTDGKYFELTITANTQEIAYEIWNDCYEYLSRNTRVEFVGCPAQDKLDEDKYYFYDTLYILNREEYEELKDLYMEWKKLYR